MKEGRGHRNVYDMNGGVSAVLLLFFTTASSTNKTYNNINEPCHTTTLSKPKIPYESVTTFNTLDINNIRYKIESGNYNFSQLSRDILSNRPEVISVILTSDTNLPTLAINLKGRLKIFRNQTYDTEIFWKNFRNATHQGWNPPFRECHLLPEQWFYMYVYRTQTIGIGIFIKMNITQCDTDLEEIYKGTHRCDIETTLCIPLYEYGEKRGGYRCMCRDGYFYPSTNFTWNGFSGEEIENSLIDSYSCLKCPSKCDSCESGGICLARRDIIMKTIILSIQLTCMCITIIMATVVFKQRKCKTISTGMWTILETILLGMFLLYLTIVIRFFEPSVLQCLLEPWARELGFIICYGAIILKLYRHLIEFRTRKAHRWIVKDTDLLKYLFIMTLSVLAYMAAYTSISLNFMQENYSLLYKDITIDGTQFETCKPLWWDYVTELGEMTILIFGIHLSYASRNASTPFHERKFLCAAISVELSVSSTFYMLRIFVLQGLHPDLILLSYFLRTQLSVTTTLFLIFVPKFWYQQKQIRSLGQEYSCRIPVDAFKDVNAHGPLAGNNSDVDVGEITLADMSPDDIRAELKRLYMQLEIFKNKTICRDNPHISKRRGGRKAQHRRFSLQNLYGKHRNTQRERDKIEIETTEAEPSRTPEDSVCSAEGPSAIFNDLPSTAPTGGDK